MEFGKCGCSDNEQPYFFGVPSIDEYSTGLAAGTISEGQGSYREAVAGESRTQILELTNGN